MKIVPRHPKPSRPFTPVRPLIRDRLERLDQIPWFRRDSIASANVLLVGVGALGNEVLKNLALFGVGRIVVCDFESVELSNLSRSALFSKSDVGKSKSLAAAEAVHRINSDITVVPLSVNILGEVGTAFFSDFDLVIAAVDSREARLAINRACWKTTRPFVDGALDVLSGVVKVFVPPDSPCYECTLNDDDFRLMPSRNSCGVARDPAGEPGVPTTSISASIIGALQAQEAIKLISHEYRGKRLCGEGYIYDGVHFESQLVRYSRKSDEICDSHETYKRVVSYPDSYQNVTIGELASWCATHGFECQCVTFERDILVSFICDQCRVEHTINAPYALQHSANCRNCGSSSLRGKSWRNSVDPRGIESEQTLEQIGIPPMDIVTLSGVDKEIRVNFADDRNLLFKKSQTD